MLTNSPSCLDNYIVFYNGCYGDDTPVPTSGYYIENLEGLTIENVAMISPELLISATQTIKEKMLFAASIVENRLKAILNSRGIKLNTLGKLYSACAVTNVADLPAAFDRGIRISKKWLNSPQSRIFIDAVRFKSKTSGPSVIKVKDLLGNVLWQQNTVLIAETEHTVFIKKHFNPDIILVTIDTTSIQPYIYICDKTTNCTPCDANINLAIDGWNGTGVGPNGYVSVCVRLDCTDKDIICQFLDRLGLAILYQTGAQIAKEWLAPNNRLNIIKTHGLEWASQMATMWESLSNEYLNNEIDNIIQILETDKFCYRCETRLRMYAMLPG